MGKNTNVYVSVVQVYIPAREREREGEGTVSDASTAVNGNAGLVNGAHGYIPTGDAILISA